MPFRAYIDGYEKGDDIPGVDLAESEVEFAVAQTCLRMEVGERNGKNAIGIWDRGRNSNGGDRSIRYAEELVIPNGQVRDFDFTLLRDDRCRCNLPVQCNLPDRPAREFLRPGSWNLNIEGFDFAAREISNKL